VDCDEIDVWVISLGLGSVDYMRRYLMFYAVLDDELASSIQYDMSQMRQFALAFAALAGLVAFVMAVYFVRPLKQMTAMSHRVTQSKPERLPANLRELIDELPVRRGDEVGDIARASQRLFQEVLTNQEQLEQRVQERTAELEEANAQLQSLSREKDAFVAKVSHDLRQPLNAIFLQVEALKLSTLDAQQQHDVRRIEDHAARELKLVNDILEYQKIIMGAETLDEDQIDPATLAEELRHNFAPLAAEKSLNLAIQVAEGLPMLTADRRRLCQILENLLSNAIKFTQEGGVALEVRETSERVVFVVRDTGRGMSSEEASKAFDPFVSNKKGNEGGTGLGLAICRELTGQMNGEIQLETAPDRGSQFTLFLPKSV
jgi:signal transduction histidine kinase